MINEIIITENNEIIIIQIADLGDKGLPGQSAYQYAIDNGLFVGTIEEWYASLTEGSEEAIQAAQSANQAAANANLAAQNVGSAITDANNAATIANNNAILAGNAAQSANQAATLANQEAASATAAALAANSSVTATNDAKDAANLAATNANDKAAIANSAASSANNAALAANNAVIATNIAKDAANLAATNANSAKDAANLATINATNAATNANQFQFKQSQFFSPKQLIAYDSFDRPNLNPITRAESGQLYAGFKSSDLGKIESKIYLTNSGTNFRESSILLTVPPTKNIGVELSFMRTTAGHTATGMAFVKDANNYIFFGQFSNATNSLFTELPISPNYQLIAVIAGVATVLGSISQYAVYPNNSGDGFAGTRMTWVIRYTNRGRGDRSTIVVQSLDKPSERIEVEATTPYNLTFASPADYNKIAIISGSNTPAYAYNIANLDI